ncbi:MAG: DUF3748 domain-containing protein [Nitrospiraceae bacterium]|nr:DUF3748 domain-containing protein [Nitrospiraceae bacterium]
MNGTSLIVVTCIAAMVLSARPVYAQERQITFNPKNHSLDNNDNFSNDGRFLCYDTRETIGPGIDNSQSVEKVEIATGKETVLYTPKDSITGDEAAPGVGAASYSAVANTVAFIHGPPLDQVPERGWYGKPNRNGAEVIADGSGRMVWLDRRDVDTSRDTIPGAHRGGTHRHEYTLDGKRIGFTYDDFILPQYGRGIGYMEKHPKAPEGATHYFALLIPIVPEAGAKPGDIVHAAGDSWVGRRGLMRAFIGKVRAEGTDDEGKPRYEESLFVIDLPADVDITTADSGSPTRYPAPPKGVSIRRLTHDWAGGIVRGTPDGDRIAYYGKAADGTTQIFIIPSDGSDRDSDPAKRPVQATRLPHGAEPGVRWHPSGNSILCISNNAVVSTCVKPGADFGRSVFLTPEGDAPAREELVMSLDGTMIAFTKQMPTNGADGKRVKTYDGSDFRQIFVLDFPDVDKKEQ